MAMIAENAIAARIGKNYSGAVDRSSQNKTAAVMAHA